MTQFPPSAGWRTAERSHATGPAVPAARVGVPSPGAGIPASPGPRRTADRDRSNRRPHWGPPVHQPGVVPLRPLTLGDIFGGALQTIRRNPKATVGMAALVTFGFMLIPIIATLALGAADALPAMDPFEPTRQRARQAPPTSAGGSRSMVSLVFSLLAGIVVTGPDRPDRRSRR